MAYRTEGLGNRKNKYVYFSLYFFGQFGILYFLHKLFVAALLKFHSLTDLFAFVEIEP